MITIRPKNKQTPAPYGLEDIRTFISTQVGSDDFELKVELSNCGHAAIIVIFPPDTQEDILKDIFKNLNEWLKDMVQDITVELTRPFMGTNAQVITYEEVHGLSFMIKKSNGVPVKDAFIEHTANEKDFSVFNFRNLDAKA